MKEDALSKLLRVALVLGGLTFVAVYVIIAVQRVRYPYELEWMEGAMVDHVRQILAGRALYGPPSLDFTPYGYGPVYTYVSAGAALIVGEGFLALRLVSFVASLGALFVLFAFVKRETKSNQAGLLAASLYAATFELSGSFFDVARVDSVFVLVLLTSLYVTRFADTRRAAITSGALFALALLSKQLVIAILPAIGLYFLFMKRRLLLPFVLSFAVVAGGAIWVLDEVFDGWTSFYLFYFHAGRHIQAKGLIGFLNQDLTHVDFAALIGLFYLTAMFKWRRDLRAGVFHLLAAGGIIGAVAISRSLSLGAFTNVLMPAHAVIALLFGLGYSEALACARSAAKIDAKWKGLTWIVLTICMMQFGRLAYDPRYHIPTPRDRAAGDQLVEWIREVDGEVFLPDHGHLTALAGKKTYVHTIAIYDAMYNERTAPLIRAAVLEGIREQTFAAILMSNALSARHAWVEDEIRKFYTVSKEPFFDEPDVFFPVTGVRLRPNRLYLRSDLSATDTDGDSH